MIYLDSAATTFQKPAAVHRAVARAMRTMSSPGRGGYESARLAEETLFRRAEYRRQEPCPAGRPRHRVWL